jgi:hypothetical protein
MSLHQFGQLSAERSRSFARYLRRCADRLSRRERLLAGALCVAAVVFAPVRAWDWYAAEAAELAEARADLQSARQLQDVRSEQRAADLVVKRLQSIRALAWRSSSFWIGGVLIEQQLATIAQQAGITPADVKSADAPEVVGGLECVRIEISGPFTWAGFSGLLKGLSRLDKLVLLDTVTVDDTQRPNLRLVVLAPIAYGETAVRR